MNVQHLGPRIYAILTGPDTDLETISAKRVRKQLQAEYADVTPDFIRDNKPDIDALIASIFECVKAGRPWRPPGAVNDESTKPAINGLALPKASFPATPITAGVKRKLDDTAPESSPAFPLKKAIPSKAVQTDAQIARQLSAEINGHSTRGSSAGPSRKARSTGKKQKKSKAEVDDSDGAEDGERPAKKAKGGFQKPYALSPALQEVVGETELSRPAVVKALWIYIKGGNLQNPANKKEILCDAKLKAVFGVEKIDMFRMNKDLGRHLGDIQ